MMIPPSFFCHASTQCAGQFVWFVRSSRLTAWKQVCVGQSEFVCVQCALDWCRLMGICHPATGRCQYAPLLIVSAPVSQPSVFVQSVSLFQPEMTSSRTARFQYDPIFPSWNQNGIIGRVVLLLLVSLFCVVWSNKHLLTLSCWRKSGQWVMGLDWQVLGCSSFFIFLFSCPLLLLLPHVTDCDEVSCGES